jgi:hypothetical protein
VRSGGKRRSKDTDSNLNSRRRQATREIYDNTFITNWSGSGPIGIKMRGGRGVIYNNTFQQGPNCPSTCSWGTIVLLSNYRSDASNTVPS